MTSPSHPSRDTACRRAADGAAPDFRSGGRKPRHGAAWIGLLAGLLAIAAQPAASAERLANDSAGPGQTRIQGHLRLGNLTFDGTDGVAAVIRQQGFACDAVASLQTASAGGVRVCCDGGAACYAISGSDNAYVVRPD